MKIETARKSRIDIGALALSSVETRPAHAPFDPRIDVSGEDKKRALRWLEAGDGLYGYINELADLLIIDPSLHQRILDTISGQDNLKLITSENPPLLIPTALFLKVFYSKKIANTNSQDRLCEGLHDDLTDNLNDYTIFHDRTHAEYVMRTAKWARLLHPDYAKDIVLNEKQEHVFREAQETFLENFESYGPHGSTDAWEHHLLRYASEETFAKAMKMYPMDWAYMRKRLDYYRESEDWGSFIRVAAELTQVVAEKIIITENSFEIILPEPPFKPEKQLPLPVLRSF